MNRMELLTKAEGVDDIIPAVISLTGNLGDEERDLLDRDGAVISIRTPDPSHARLSLRGSCRLVGPVEAGEDRARLLIGPDRPTYQTVARTPGGPAVARAASSLAVMVERCDPQALEALMAGTVDIEIRPHRGDGE